MPDRNARYVTHRNPVTQKDSTGNEPRFVLYSLCPCAVCQNTGKDAVGDRCEACRGEGKQRVRVAEAETAQALGVALITTAREGAWPDGCQFGLLDQEGDVGRKWLVRPWQASPTARNAADAAKVLAAKRWK